MDAARFQNALRILWNIEVLELHAWHVIDENWGTPMASDRNQIGAFLDNPDREIFRMPDANFEKLWALVESKQPKTAPTDDMAEMVEALAQCEEYLENRADVIDGSYGIPEPNEEMQLLTLVRDAFPVGISQPRQANDAGQTAPQEN